MAVVPLRDGSSGKSRFAQSLAPAARTELVGVLARHVVGTLLDSGQVARVAVVTEDGAFASSVTSGWGTAVDVLVQPPARRGLNSAVDLGREMACAALGASSVLLVIHADLPLLTAADVEALVAPTASVVLAGDRLRTGTNALVLRPAECPFTFHFGHGSLAAHLAEAEARGLEPAVVERSGTAADLDTPADWAQLPRAARDRLVRAVPALSSLPTEPLPTEPPSTQPPPTQPPPTQPPPTQPLPTQPCQ